jgi:hypothetical protein
MDPNEMYVVGGLVQTAAAAGVDDCREPSPDAAMRHSLCADSHARTLFLAWSKMRS